MFYFRRVNKCIKIYFLVELEASLNSTVDTVIDATDPSQQQLQDQNPDQEKEDTPTIAKLSLESSQICDDNQNNMDDMNNKLMVENQNNNNNIDNSTLNTERFCNNCRHLLTLYAKLKKQIVQYTDTKVNEQITYKAKTEELSQQVCVNFFDYFLSEKFISFNFFLFLANGSEIGFRITPQSIRL